MAPEVTSCARAWVLRAERKVEIDVREELLRFAGIAGHEIRFGEGELEVGFAGDALCLVGIEDGRARSAERLPE